MPTNGATYHAVQAQTVRATERAVARLWGRVDADDVSASWARVRPLAVQAVALGQQRAATAATAFLAATLTADGLEAEAPARVVPAAFAGRTAAGLSLDDVLDTMPIRVKQGLLGGATVEQAMRAALLRGLVIVGTEVQDAGRGAMGVAMRIEPRVIGYERHVASPSCSRCIVLAGRLYRANEGFQRHPHCDCVHVPVTRSQHYRESMDQQPSALFRSMTPAQQDATFGVDGARAIRNGADISQVVNARRGMSRAGDAFTTEGTTRRGSFGRQSERRGGTATRTRGDRYARTTERRLSVGAISRAAGDDDARFVELLRRYGYIA